MPFVPQVQQPAILQDFGNVDPATYMSPMDLYDSIFWGESILGNSGSSGEADLSFFVPN